VFPFLFTSFGIVHLCSGSMAITCDSMFVYLKMNSNSFKIMVLIKMIISDK
jgi:hypothetical protein